MRHTFKFYSRHVPFWIGNQFLWVLWCEWNWWFWISRGFSVLKKLVNILRVKFRKLSKKFLPTELSFVLIILTSKKWIIVFLNIILGATILWYLLRHFRPTVWRNDIFSFHKGLTENNKDGSSKFLVDKDWNQIWRLNLRKHRCNIVLNSLQTKLLFFILLL